MTLALTLTGIFSTGLNLGGYKKHDPGSRPTPQALGAVQANPGCGNLRRQWQGPLCPVV